VARATPAVHRVASVGRRAQRSVVPRVSCHQARPLEPRPAQQKCAARVSALSGATQALNDCIAIPSIELVIGVCETRDHRNYCGWKADMRVYPRLPPRLETVPIGLSRSPAFRFTRCHPIISQAVHGVFDCHWSIWLLRHNFDKSGRSRNPIFGKVGLGRGLLLALRASIRSGYRQRRAP
jgi:hypothetical protein